MNDHVGGIAVVEPLTGDLAGLYRICLSLRHKDGHQSPCSLLFHDKSAPPSKELLDLARKPVWCFAKDQPQQGWLDCQPSIKQTIQIPNESGKMVEHERFHNTFNWQVQYVWLKYTACDAQYNIWKALNQYGSFEDGTPVPPVTAETFRRLRDDGYIC